MALSYARPDPSSPAAVASASFTTTRKGFDQAEVRDYLQQVAAELSRLQERERELERQLEQARRLPPPSVEDLDEATVTTMLGEETARVLSTAREAAAQIRSKAEEGSARLFREAQDDATRLREQAELEAARRRQEAAHDAEAEVEAARQQGRDMVAEAREYREKVLADLAKRRELARQQLADLQSGRERLLQAFERARIAAVDVQVELTELGVEPDELVNLAPTTGPVPITVPRRDVPLSPRPAQSAALPISRPRIVPALVEPEPEAPVAEDPSVVEAPPMAEEADVEAPGIETADPEAPIQEPLVEPEVEATVVESPDEVTPETVEAETSSSGAVALPVDVDAVDVDAVDAVDVVDVVDAVDAVEVDVAPPSVPPEDGLAPVVALFAGELDTSTSDEVEIAPVDDAATDKPTVDDLFARLRASKIDEIVLDPAPASDGAPEAPAAITAAAPAERVAPTEPEPVTVAQAIAAAAIVPDTDEDVAADSDAVADSPFVVRDEGLAPIELSLSRRFKRALADEQNDLLDVLRRKEPVRSIDEVLPTAGPHLAPYLEAATDELPAAARAGARSVSSEDPERIDRRLADAGVVAKTVSAAAADIVEPLRERLQAAIADAAGDNGVIAAAVRSMYRDWKTRRLDELAEELTRAAYAGGAYAVIVPGTPVRWVSEPGYNGCRSTVANETAGPVRAGDAFPSGHVSPPSAPSCRCLLVTTDR